MSRPKVENHWLTWEAPEVTLAKKRERWGAPIVPEVIVAHYGVTHTLTGLVSAQRARGYWAHLSIDGMTAAGRGTDYQIHQALPFNERGSHAGPSEWRGREGVNGFSIGIEISNPGPLIRGADGKLRTVYRKEWPEDEAIEARHKYPRAPAAWTHWAQYTDQEIDILVGVCSALSEAYPTIVDIVGHDDVAPGRKFDPGPAMDLDYVRSKVFR